MTSVMRKKSARTSNIANGGRRALHRNAWRAELDSASINDDRWWCIVTMMAGTTAEHSRYIALFNEAAEARQERTPVYPLGYQKVIVTMKALSRQDPEKCPVIQGICHYANAVLSENSGGLSTWLLARLIKYLIYRAKIERTERVELQADVGREIDGEYRTLQNIEGSTSSQSPSGIRTVDCNGREYVLRGKANARSRERYVNAVSSDGPNLYVVLSGFHDPDLPEELLSIGVPLTCILEIKLPHRQRAAAHRRPEREEGALTSGKKPRHSLQDYCTDANELLEFWTVTKARRAKPSEHPAHSEIAILPFCPPILPDTWDETGVTEKESLARETLERAFLTLRHLYYLHRRHANYLKSMRLERGIVEARSETASIEIYESALSDVPNERIDVPLILSAILLQVESNLARSGADVRHPSAESRARHNKSESDNDATREDAVKDKLKLLDLKYELCEERTDEPQTTDPKLLLHGDTLGAIARYLPREYTELLVDVALRVLRDPRITKVWQDHETPADAKVRMYACHLENIARQFERTVSRTEVAHYLNLLMLDKLIFSGNQRDKNKVELRASSSPPMDDEWSELKRARRSLRRRARSESAVTSRPTVAASGSLRRAESDASLEYGKPVIAFTDCPLLFALTDTRETLLPGYLVKNVFERRSYARPTIDEYEDVELLPDRVFLQAAGECFQSFDRFAASYCEPTDAVLLYFSNNSGTDGASEETSLSSILTPVRFRDFCEYIARVEENWMKREQETRQSELAGRFMKKSTEVEDDAIIFDDECFVLPDSLKARRLRESPDRDMHKKILGARVFSAGREEEEEEEEQRVEGDKIIGRRKRDEARSERRSGNERPTNGRRIMSGGTSMTEKKSDSEINDVDTSFPAAEKILSPGCAAEGEPYDFVGYDLGSLRVQVSHRGKKFFLPDDITVRIEVDDWLYGDSELRVAVILPDCALRFFGGINRTADAFHLTAGGGVVLSFCRNGARPAENSPDRRGRNLAFDFRACWPSGLLIEPTIGGGTKNPFCIRQSYVAKRPARAGAAREVRRNFLRNGTVLRYLDDNTVVILRPNGVIVTCTDFDRRQAPDESIHQTTSDGSDSLITGVCSAGKVLRYSIVNYDGRRYEVLNDLVVSEHDRLLVRTTSDYEVNEIFTRRADGTNMLFRPNGELAVTFPDGTRITSGYTVEEQPVICEWSEDELRRYFGSPETNEYGDGASVASSSDNKSPRVDSAASYVDYHEKLTRASIADGGFVSISLILRMEHKDYATVSYDQSIVGCTLSLPGDLRVSISRRGHYEVSMGDEVNLKIRDDGATLTKMCATCGGRSTSTYKFGESSETGPRTVLTAIDILGNVLAVKSDGAASYYRAGRECNGDVLERGEVRRSVDGDDGDNEEEEDDDHDDDDEEEDEEEEEEEEEEDEEKEKAEDAKSEASLHCKHQRYCEKLKFPARSQYRIFAMNRDLTAYEYLHRSVRREQEVAGVFGDETSMIQYPISRRPELRHLITFVPVEPESGSKGMPYRVASEKRTDNGGIELRRSTYSFPYNWLFPFGERDARASKRTHGEVLAKQNEQPLPELLRVRVFFGIKEADGSALIDIHRAMGRYWISVFRDGDKCRLFYATGSTRPCEVENDYESSENGLRDLALGFKGSIDVQTYVRSLRG